MNVKDTGNEKYVYDITLKEADSLPNSQGFYDGSFTASKRSISSKNGSVNSNKKYSIDIDEDLFALLDEEYSKTEQEMASIIKDGFASMQNVQVDERQMRKIAGEIRREYKSNCNMDELTQNLIRVFAYLQDTQNVSYEDMVRLVQEISKPVIEESTEVDPAEQELYNNARAALKNKKIRLSEQQKKEVAHYYGSYNDFHERWEEIGVSFNCEVGSTCI